jgi:hypothetical protein
MRRVTKLFLVLVCAGCWSGTFAQTTVVHAKQFDSPEAAAQALIDAASKDDKVQLTAVLGSSAKGILTSGNAVQDEQEIKSFAELASAKSRVEHSSVTSKAAILLIGNDDWPFPIPIVKTGQQWHFDAERGADEMRARRIGADELDAIEICAGYVDAQDSYGSVTGYYAQQLMSTPGHGDGLFQPDTANALVPEAFAAADTSLPAGKRKPYHGYVFHVLKQQSENAEGGAHKYLVGGVMMGGFALIASPAEYGVTGIHTFIVSHEGRVYEKDFGPRTLILTAPILSYDPDDSWTAVN